MPFTHPYRSRLAPSPTGYLHLGHARTFWAAQERARARGGTLILRNEDLDSTRYKMEFVEAMLEDLRWFGFEWSEGPDLGGPFAPYNQSERMDHYRATLEKLRAANHIYPCTCSRKDIRDAVTAPHGADDEAIYPGTCRPKSDGWRVTGGVSPVSFSLNHGARNVTGITHHVPLNSPGVSAFPTAKPSSSPTATSARSTSSPAKISAISSSGAATACRPISLPV